ncbi:B12-binding domain-containing radical SAM protein [Geothermobacter hydrogeniphilus]|uniref:B12-binding domain-containing radical SAM protein n=1 Tax=Geothermobacter hydrogeniphilus TaxID=1969733 RepID=A0A2K2HBH7_9BACT|nr:radical SAM protein [Geothermobacter hydrogeniphilus]PNU20617.1 B12-binding domain-containing radical SAM protein [Geothermobacter hydrogeniphilus]
MRILFVNPPNCGRSIPEERYGIDSIKQIFRGEPLALETLAGNLADHQIDLVDLKVEPSALSKRLQSFAPDIVAFTAMTCEAQTVLKLARQVRRWKTVQIVVGGIHASNDPEFFNREEIDWVVIGLGKQSLRELVDNLEKGLQKDIPGIAPTSPGHPLRWQPRTYDIRDLAQQVSPRYDLVAPYRKEYRLESLEIQLGMVATAAGCPYDCHFCCISPVTGGRYLGADTQTVIRDLNCLDQAPVVRLVDANSFGNPAQALSLAEAIATAGIYKQYLADVRADTVVRHPELLKRWKEVGLRAVVIGFEEITDKALSKMNKENSAATNREAITILHQLGLAIVGDFIISPDYDESQFEQLSSFVKKQGIELPMYTVLTPLPGTRLHCEMADRITLTDLDYYTLTNAVLPTRLPEELFYQRYATLLQEGHHNARI